MDVAEPWWRVRPPTALNGDLEQVLASVDSLQVAWAETVEQESFAEFHESRQRNLHRHAIETGIIERLYDVDWGVTQALVAEGLSAEVAEREGGVDAGAVLQSERGKALSASVAGLAGLVNAHVAQRLESVGVELRDQFRTLDPSASFDLHTAEPPDEHARWWQAQVIKTARRGGFTRTSPTAPGGRICS